MNTTQSWLDTDEVRRLAEELSAPPIQQEEKDDTRVPMAMVTNALASARKVAEGCGILQEQTSVASEKEKKNDVSEFDKVESKVAPAHFSQSEKEESQELERGIDPFIFIARSEAWCEQFHFRALVLLNSDLEIVVDTSGDEKFTEMVKKMGEVNPTSGSLFVKVDSDIGMQVITIPLANEVYKLGLLISSALTSDQVKEILSQVLKGNR